MSVAVENTGEITLLMTMTEMARFVLKVEAIQKHYGTASVADTVQRAIDEVWQGVS